MSRSAFFGLVLPVVVGLAVVVGIWRSLWAPITTDEGANLEVVSNAASGVGYASHGTHRLDMWWSAKPIYAKLLGTNPPSVYRPEPWFFDPRITTGPSVLLPLSLVWFVFPGNLLLLRLITVGFLVLFLVALWRLSAGQERWLTFAAAGSITLTYRFGPAVTLGDLAAVAYLAWGTILLLRTRTFWAGILFGLAVLAKLVAFVGVMGALGVFLALTYFTPVKQRRPNLLVLGLGAALPLLLFEVYRFVLLGSPSDYMVSWKEFIDFLQWRTGPGSAERLTSKLRFLGQFGPGTFFGLCYFTLAARILVSWKELKKIWKNEDATGRTIAPGLMFCG
ncbi:MAG: hypothetical protein RMI39_10750, partial [Thermoanaerobaculum sp.]|nr:hypothetical protein [Thermoanaerobaculum sp.]